MCIVPLVGGTIFSHLMRKFGIEDSFVWGIFMGLALLGFLIISQLGKPKDKTPKQKERKR